jgi:hypothetical protein
MIQTFTCTSEYRNSEHCTVTEFIVREVACGKDEEEGSMAMGSDYGKFFPDRVVTWIEAHTLDNEERVTE